MTTITATVIADSISDYGPRLTTMLLEYPRWIHAEFMTHRVFSRNAASSRAIPVSRMIKAVQDNPAVPMFWGANQRGMQAGEECNTKVSITKPMATYVDLDELSLEYWGDDMTREAAWLHARDQAVKTAQAFSNAGYHKQIVNRLLEPFSHIKVVVTATAWSNFFALRRHADAEPHIKLLADRMWEAREASTPRQLAQGYWHLPFVAFTPLKGFEAEAVKLSVARCASTSYDTVDGFEMTIDRAIALHDKLVSSTPMHTSPCEHQAQATKTNGWGGNLGDGWVQYRKTLEGENL
jgi:hypothetical protein